MKTDKVFINYTNEIYNKYGATLINLSDTKMVHRTMVEFKCKCGIIQTTQYRLIIKRGTFCKKCCVSNSLQKRKITLESINNKQTKLYNKLCNIEKNNNCVILNKNDITCNSVVEFICSCGTNDSTLYRNIRIRGGLCRNCSNNLAYIKRTNTFKKKYNTTHPTNTPHIIEKIRNTNIERYNVAHPAQSPFINCNTYKSKKYITPTGKQYIIQGYEHIALDELFQQYSDNDIIIGKSIVPQINYTYNDNKKVYYPDIYIPKENKIIEVKSTWTYKIQLDKNTCKANKCKSLGYIYEFWIYDNKKNKQIIYPE